MVGFIWFARCYFPFELEGVGWDGSPPRGAAGNAWTLSRGMGSGVLGGASGGVIVSSGLFLCSGASSAHLGSLPFGTYGSRS